MYRDGVSISLPNYQGPAMLNPLVGAPRVSSREDRPLAGLEQMIRHSRGQSVPRTEYSLKDLGNYKVGSKISDTPAARPRPKTELISVYEHYTTYYLTSPTSIENRSAIKLFNLPLFTIRVN